MSNAIGMMIADSLEHGLRNAERLLHQVDGAQFARLARPGGETVRSNHGAFVLGHLSIYGPRIVEHLGGDGATLAPPEGFVQVFSKDAKCVDDPDGTVYPPMDSVTAHFFHVYRTALEQLRATDDALMLLPNPSGGRLTELFPTVGSMLAFYSGGHVMLHLGQMSAWRRMLGLGEA